MLARALLAGNVDHAGSHRRDHREWPGSGRLPRPGTHAGLVTALIAEELTRIGKDEVEDVSRTGVQTGIKYMAERIRRRSLGSVLRRPHLLRAPVLLRDQQRPDARGHSPEDPTGALREGSGDRRPCRRAVGQLPDPPASADRRSSTGSSRGSTRTRSSPWRFRAPRRLFHPGQWMEHPHAGCPGRARDGKRHHQQRRDRPRPATHLLRGTAARPGWVSRQPGCT